MLKSLNKDTIKERIANERKKRGWTQSQLAKKAKITPAAICQIEQGTRIPTIPVLHKIANVLKVSLDYLAGQADSLKLKDILQNKDLNKFFRKYIELSEEDKQFIEKYINAKAKNYES